MRNARSLTVAAADLGQEWVGWPLLHMFIMSAALSYIGDLWMAVCTKKAGEDCDRNYHNRPIVEGCPENQADIEQKKPVYDLRGSKNRCLSALEN
jgi:hypothetical protein